MGEDLLVQAVGHCLKSAGRDLCDGLSTEEPRAIAMSFDDDSEVALYAIPDNQRKIKLKTKGAAIVCPVSVPSFYDCKQEVS